MPPTITPNERQLVFTSSQAALYLGVSLATIRRWTDAGHIACYRTPGGQRRFSRAQLDGFITSMSQEGPVESVETARSDAAHQSFLKATAVSLLNPNPYISWSTVMGPMVLRAWAEAVKLANIEPQ